MQAIADTLTLVHDASGMPHWATLAVCTVALRAALFPLTALSMRSMTVNAAILRTAGIVAAREGKSRWDLFRRARHNARAPGLWWPVVNAGVQLLALVELARTVRKMAFVGWPGFHNEGPLLFDGKLTSLLVGVALGPGTGEVLAGALQDARASLTADAAHQHRRAFPRILWVPPSDGH